MIKGISHLTFSVSDLDESFRFYTDILSFRPLARWDKGAYLLAGETWICLSLDAETRNSPSSEYTHTAFAVAEKEFQAVSEQIIRSGTKQWQKNRSEGNSFYFLDPDGHKMEIHSADWQSRLASCRDKPYSGMVFFD